MRAPGSRPGSDALAVSEVMSKLNVVGDDDLSPELMNYYWNNKLARKAAYEELKATFAALAEVTGKSVEAFQLPKVRQGTLVREVDTEDYNLGGTAPLFRISAVQPQHVAIPPPHLKRPRAMGRSQRPVEVRRRCPCRVEKVL